MLNNYITYGELLDEIKNSPIAKHLPLNAYEQLVAYYAKQPDKLFEDIEVLTLYLKNHYNSWPKITTLPNDLQGPFPPITSLKQES